MVSFTQLFNSYFIIMQFTCIDDISGCASNPCHANAACVDIDDYGNFTCSCYRGYTGDGINCASMAIIYLII